MGWHKNGLCIDEHEDCVLSYGISGLSNDPSVGTVISFQSIRVAIFQAVGPYILMEIQAMCSGIAGGGCPADVQRIRALVSIGGGCNAAVDRIAATF